ncbi:23S rRNA pseudouridine(2605) synthase RluB [Candidatus Nitrotoga sp. 1052]|uniref:23S rRNA pseudouridine(2605) synthase RluB n=1 Tax=Candidatus Nitrotoga sp. 1052 TaxID=2886964 RepID=UPI001EF44F5F|nr:pseudouridine synthase [Candidatus Nitrotoga sp. 1052]CAH1091073.1 23S rRNA pseudouridine(2605) synthase [Candidatus Nitrotoga sp. 1052]
MSEQVKQQEQQGERLQKVLAQVGLGSRRTMEEWISAGRITVNGEVATLGMRVTEDDVVRADKRIVHIKTNSSSLPRVLLYHKQEGEIVSRDDPEKRANVFDKLPKLRGMKWIAIGRLDFNTSGLLIFTTSGDLANRLMHPRFEVEREYAVRVQGSMTDEQMEQMVKEGITLEDGPVKFEKLTDEGGEGYNHWYRLMLKEGRNRIVRRTFDALGLPISRLIRVRFGIINLPPRLKRGALAELGAGEVSQILDWVGMESKPITEKAAERTGSKAGKFDNEIMDAGLKNRKPGTGMSAAPHGKTDARRSATQFKNKVRP